MLFSANATSSRAGGIPLFPVLDLLLVVFLQ